MQAPVQYGSSANPQQEIRDISAVRAGLNEMLLLCPPTYFNTALLYRGGLFCYIAVFMGKP